MRRTVTVNAGDATEDDRVVRLIKRSRTEFLDRVAEALYESQVLEFQASLPGATALTLRL
jgi:hypothetical protein